MKNAQGKHRRVKKKDKKIQNTPDDSKQKHDMNDIDDTGKALKSSNETVQKTSIRDVKSTSNNDVIYSRKKKSKIKKL